MAAARGPLTLRDFLELACDSSSDGFRSYPRSLPSHGGGANNDTLLRRSPSRSPSSSFFRSPSALARISSLSRSFSRRIKDGFWRRRDYYDDDHHHHLYDDLDDRDSCGFPSPLVSSCSSASSEHDAESESDDDVAAVVDKMASTSASERGKPATPSSSSSSSTSASDHHCTDTDAAAAAAGKNEMMQSDGKLGREEDKQQLSPVSVLDFPFDDDDRSDAGTCSPSFSFQGCCPTTTPPEDLLLHHSRTTTKQVQLLHKIRRYDGESVEPVDLEARFTATSESGESLEASTHLATTTTTDTSDTTSATTTTAPCHGEEHQSVERPSSPDDQDEEPDEHRLLARLLQDDTAAAAAAVVDDEVSRAIVLDFFAEGIHRLRCSTFADTVVLMRSVDDGDHRDKQVAAEALLVGAAAEWLRGAGLQWGIRDVMLSGKAALEDMERGRRWMSVGDEERDVGAEVEGVVMDELVDEMVADLVLPRWHNDGRRWRCH
ncbi:hypothetical protein HU200_001887 [Digitaria exilis]|uniref:Uncharacterized protein n=1 Tax=Digitaria exilis TaxID=1010633 RepID=A0A835KW43_9POAL|nr:hypothetical protein HU200_001887 [Digitaria exilis]CAB3497267.1 unnamed protein product [Digitaria exilis]